MLLSHSYKVSLVRSVVLEAVVLGASVLEMAVTIRLSGDVRIESDGEKFQAKKRISAEMPIGARFSLLGNSRAVLHTV